MKPRGVSLIVGADGLMGRAVADYLVHSGKRVLETTRRLANSGGKRILVDLTGDLTHWCPPPQVSVAYLCAAVSSLESCRREPGQSAGVNVHSTVALAKKLVAAGAFVIFPSTNLVYDGSVPFRKAEDSVCPVTEYGRQKAQAEKQLLSLENSIAVVRFTKVLSPNLPLISGWIEALRNSKAIHPFSDMMIAPLSLPFAVDVLHRVAEARRTGIFQVSGERDVSYEQIARYMARRIGAPLGLVQPVRSKEGGGRLQPVPSHTTLDMTRVRTELGIDPPDVWTTIDSVFGQ